MTQRLRDSSVCHHRPSVPCVPWPHPSHTTSISLRAHGMPSACPAGALLTPCPWDSPSQHPRLPGSERLYTGRRAAFCHLPGGATTWPTDNVPRAACGSLLCSPASWCEGPANRRDRLSACTQLELALLLDFRHWQLMKTATLGGQAWALESFWPFGPSPCSQGPHAASNTRVVGCGADP